MNERAEFEEMLVRTGVAKDIFEKGHEKGHEKGREKGREERTREFLGLLRSGKSPEEIIKLYDKNEYKPENPTT